jgi:hypothetical protein
MDYQHRPRKPQSKLLAAAIPFLFIVGLPAALIAYVAHTPQAPAGPHAELARAQAEHRARIQDEIRKCSIGLDVERCREAIYCADDPSACAYIMNGEGRDERPSPDRL